MFYACSYAYIKIVFYDRFSILMLFSFYLGCFPRSACIGVVFWGPVCRGGSCVFSAMISPQRRRSVHELVEPFKGTSGVQQYLGF